MDITNVKGTHDILLDEASAYNHIEDTMKLLAQIFSYKEIRTPVIENSALFQRGVGESSDVVRKEMYTFLDKGGRSITLRPEFTAGIVRSFVNNKLYANHPLPFRGYYCGPVFRYERPGLGRYRQFNQFGVETLGSNSYLDDVDAIVLGYSILQTLGFERVEVLINTLGDEESRANYKAALKDYFKDKIENMCSDCKERYNLNPLRILDCKVKEDQEIVKDAPRMKDYLSEAAKERFEKVSKALDDLGIPCVFDDTLVRGLDYYSETVFEFHCLSSKGIDYGAIGAGGHYSNLVNELGGPKLDGVGFSFGIERVYSVMNDNGLLNEIKPSTDLYIMPLGENAVSPAYYLGTNLRIAGYQTEIDLSGSKLPAMFKKAEKANAKYALIIGEDEVANNKVQVKDLEKKTQETIAIDDLFDYLDKAFDFDDGECCCKGETEVCEGEEGECCCKHHD